MRIIDRYHDDEGLCLDTGCDPSNVLLELTQEELDDLVFVIGSIGGAHTGTARMTLDPLWNLLRDLHSINHDRMAAWEEAKAKRLKGLFLYPPKA